MALFLSLLLLGSQVGFAVSTHFCGGEISERAISLVGSTVGCGMENQESSCSMGKISDDTFSEKSCCDNESHIYQFNNQVVFGQVIGLKKHQNAII